MKSAPSCADPIGPGDAGADATTDGGPEPDAAIEDASSDDATSPEDAATTPEDAATTPADDAAPADGATTAGDDSSADAGGCGCTTPRTNAGSAGALAGLALAYALARRRVTSSGRPTRS